METKVSIDTLKGQHRSKKNIPNPGARTNPELCMGSCMFTMLLFEGGNERPDHLHSRKHSSSPNILQQISDQLLLGS